MFCRNEDVQRYVPEFDEALIYRARWAADLWLTKFAPATQWLDRTVPPAVLEASALLAATLIGDGVEIPEKSVVAEERVPNAVRLMLIPWVS